MNPALIGKMLANRYEVLARVGEGGMAVVYRARDTLLGRMVALKVLRPQYASDAEFVERFRREAQTAASLSHPNVVNIHDVGEEDGIYYIVMEYVEGRNLKEIIRQEGPLPARTAIFIAREICRALEAAHRLNLIHRDVKPHNILITFDGRVKVTDFGIARAAATASLTQTGTVIGSVHYASPEQVRGEPVGTSSDIYSLGVLCYEMVTGTVPFTGDSPVSIALKHLQEQPKPPRQINPNVPADFERIILRAMAKTEEQRYPSATVMLRDLRGLGDEFASVSGDDEITQPMTPVDLGNTTLLQIPDDEAKTSRKGVRKRRKKQSSAWLWPVVILSFLGGLLWAGKALPDLIFPNDVRVPNVVGLDIREAERIVKEAGLVLTRERSVYDARVPVNHVISQDPPENRRVRSGRAVLVTLSKGPEFVSVPDVIGLSQTEAAQRLEKAGLAAGKVTEERKAGTTAGTVLRQDPAGGSRLEKTGRVNLVVSGSDQPALKVVVPDLIDLPVDTAKARLTELGLKVGNTYAEPGGTPGMVTDQKPVAGTEVDSGSAVDFVYAPKADTSTDTSGPRLLRSATQDNVVERVVHIPVPEGPDVEVTVVVEDDLGRREAFKEVVPGGKQVSYTVRGRGKKPVVKVYFNGKLHDEQPLR